jgi:hypothetical protein
MTLVLVWVLLIVNVALLVVNGRALRQNRRTLDHGSPGVEPVPPTRLHACTSIRSASRLPAPEACT